MVTHSRTSLRPGRLRPLNVPRPLHVELSGDGAPVAVVRNGRRRPVQAILDDWRIDDEWWRTTIARHYYRLLLEDGCLLTVFQDELARTWAEQQYPEAVGR